MRGPEAGPSEGAVMWKGLGFALAGLAVGFAVAVWLAPSSDIDDSAATPAVSAPTADAAAGVDRVRRLEAALADETTARTALEAKVAMLTEQLRTLATEVPAPAQNDGETTQTTADEQAPRPRGFRGFGIDREELQRRQQDALVAAGFSTDRAESIMRRASELRMQSLQAQYDAARDGKPFNPAEGGDNTLRSELGDADYERYLQALNRPTTVAVRDVLASSPAEQAGLEPGDQVVAYDGKRVFDMRDLNALTLQGAAGQPVVVDVQRDGQRVQVVLPRGPVGILSGGRFGPRP